MEKPLSEYEQQREENIRRKREMISSLRLKQKSSDLSSLLRPERKITKNPLNKTKNSVITPRKSLRSRGFPPSNIQNFDFIPPRWSPSGRFSFSDVYTSTQPYRPLIESVQSATTRRERECKSRKDLDLRVDLELKQENRKASEWVTALRFLPVWDQQIILMGDREGHLGFWNADLKSGNKSADDLFVFFPHRSYVSGLAVHPSSLTKKEMFDMIYSSNYPIIFFCQSPDNHNLLYLGQNGPVKSFDERVGKICNTWELCDGRINTIDFNANNSNIFVTSGFNGFARIWDLRKISTNNYECVKEIQHARELRSAYFSPTGTSLVSTSTDDTIQILRGSNYDNLSIIKHNNWIRGKYTSFGAIWGWSDSDILVGNVECAIDVISTDDNTITPIKSQYMPVIPCYFVANSYKEGHLACASNNSVYLWTKV